MVNELIFCMQIQSYLWLERKSYLLGEIIIFVGETVIFLGDIVWRDNHIVWRDNHICWRDHHTYLRQHATPLVLINLANLSRWFCGIHHCDYTTKRQHLVTHSTPHQLLICGCNQCVCGQQVSLQNFATSFDFC